MSRWLARGLHPAPRTCYKGFDSCKFIVCCYNKERWILLPTSRKSSKAGGALAETEPFSSLAHAQVPSNNINSLCLLQPVHRHFLQSADVKIKHTELQWLGHTAKNKVSPEERKCTWLDSSVQYRIPPPFFPAHLRVPCKKKIKATNRLRKTYLSKSSMSPGTQEAQKPLVSWLAVTTMRLAARYQLSIPT